MLPAEVVSRLFEERDILGLQLLHGSEKKTLYFQIETVEGPNDLMDFSLGTASAMSVTGTDWDEIQDSANRFWLEPEYENIIYQCFMGVRPGSAWVYRRYPSNRDINSLLGTRAIGSAQGYIDGWKSPALTPSPLSEFFVLKGSHPSFLGYNPYADPASITVRLNFYVTRYDVKFLGTEVPAQRAVIRSVGGHELIPVPAWLETRLRK